MSQQVQERGTTSSNPAWYKPIRDGMRWIGSHERTVLIALILIAGGVWIFGTLAGLVIDGDTHSFDERVLLLLRTPHNHADPLGPHWVEEMGRDFTALGGTGILVMVTLLVSGYLILIRKFHALFLMLSVVVGAWFLSLGFKALFDRPRPDLVPHAAAVYNASFPSGHALLSAAFYLTLGVLLARIHTRRRLRGYFLAAAITIAIIVGISRVYLGVHWPTDVLAGWTLGGTWALLCWLLTRWLQRRGQVEEGDTEIGELRVLS